MIRPNRSRRFCDWCEASNGVLGIVAIGLAFLRSVDLAQTDAFSAVIAQGFESMAVENGDNRPEMSSGEGGNEEASVDIEKVSNLCPKWQQTNSQLTQKIK